MVVQSQVQNFELKLQYTVVLRKKTKKTIFLVHVSQSCIGKPT